MGRGLPWRTDPGRSAMPWLVLEQPTGGTGWGGIKEMLGKTREDEVGSKELFCS